jgi:hypothetical protein
MAPSVSNKQQERWQHTVPSVLLQEFYAQRALLIIGRHRPNFILEPASLMVSGVRSLKSAKRCWNAVRSASVPGHMAATLSMTAFGQKQTISFLIRQFTSDTGHETTVKIRLLAGSFRSI